MLTRSPKRLLLTSHPPTSLQWSYSCSVPRNEKVPSDFARVIWLWPLMHLTQLVIRGVVQLKYPKVQCWGGNQGPDPNWRPHAPKPVLQQDFRHAEAPCGMNLCSQQPRNLRSTWAYQPSCCFTWGWPGGCWHTPACTDLPWSRWRGTSPHPAATGIHKGGRKVMSLPQGPIQVYTQGEVTTYWEVWSTFSVVTLVPSLFCWDLTHWIYLPKSPLSPWCSDEAVTDGSFLSGFKLGSPCLKWYMGSPVEPETRAKITSMKCWMKYLCVAGGFSGLVFWIFPVVLTHDLKCINSVRKSRTALFFPTFLVIWKESHAVLHLIISIPSILPSLLHIGTLFLGGEGRGMLVTS